MAENNNNPFDRTPNEVILKIFSYLDGLADRSILAQVSHRMNILANDGNWRESIKISREEFEKFSTSSSSRLSFVEALINELAASNRLNNLIIELPFNAYGNMPEPQHNMIDAEERSAVPRYEEYKEFLTTIKDIIQKMENYCCDCTISNNFSAYNFIAYFSPKWANDNIEYHLFNTTCIEFAGKDSDILEKILEKSKDSLRAIRAYCPLTLPLLTQISKCIGIVAVHLFGELILQSNVDFSNLPKIKAVFVSLGELEGSLQSDQIAKIIAAIFYSEELHELLIPSLLLESPADEIFSRCPNLTKFHVVMGNDSYVSNVLFPNFFDTFSRYSRQFRNIKQVHFYSLEEHLITSLRDFFLLFQMTRDRVAGYKSAYL